MQKYEFEIVKDGMTFRDAIVLPNDHELSDSDIEAIKQKRFDDWCAIIAAQTEDEIVPE
jgi:hypothetical protein